MISIEEMFSIALFCIGLYGLVARKNIIITIISLGILQSAIILFFLNINFEGAVVPPIGDNMVQSADPLPQALMITAIVIGVAVTAVGMTMFISLYHRYGTTNWGKVSRKRSGKE
jgi:multicomponent Na+:H+ antiporter subunit C